MPDTCPINPPSDAPGANAVRGAPQAWRPVVPGLYDIPVPHWDVFVSKQGRWWFWTVIDETPADWRSTARRGCAARLADAKREAERAFTEMQAIASGRPHEPWELASRRAGRDAG